MELGARLCELRQQKEPDPLLGLACGVGNFLDQDDLDEHFIVIRDAHAGLEGNQNAVARLRALVGRIVGPAIRREDRRFSRPLTIFLVSSKVYVAPELEPFITVFDAEPPNENAIKQMIDEHSHEYRYRIEHGVASKLVIACRGLSEYEITRLLNRGYQKDGVVGADDVEL